MQFSQLTDWQKGDRFLAAHMQEGVAAIREVRRSLGGGTGAESNLLLKEWRLGVTADPPSGSSQYTDPRYWVKWSYVDTGTNVDSVAKPAAITFPTMTTDDGRTQYPLEPSPVTVTNLAELTVSSGTTDGAGTHSLAVGTPVLCVALYDAADQYGVQRKRWVMDVPVGGSMLTKAKVTSSTGLKGGVYYGRLQTANPAPTSSDLTGSGAMTLPLTGATYSGADDVVIINRVELGTSYHWLTNASNPNPYVVGEEVGTVTISGTTYPILYVEAARPKGC
jgi:hypothetical protein